MTAIVIHGVKFYNFGKDYERAEEAATELSKKSPFYSYLVYVDKHSKTINAYQSGYAVSWFTID